MSVSRLTLKLATSLDGRIATADGESRWITGPNARAIVHKLRAEHDAVMVGIETARLDDPELTVRLDGYAGSQPVRVVLDSRQRLPVQSKLVQTARQIPTILVSNTTPSPELTDLGVVVLQVGDQGRLVPSAVLAALAGRGLWRIFLEGGGMVAASFLGADLVDALEWFRAPMVLGQGGRPAIGALALKNLAAAPRFRRKSLEILGDDAWERYERI
ncbi:MAG: deaminase [Phenylobacterium zucineum]|nr:MAG: deaminase [Phenylobacterium zucineum]